MAKLKERPVLSVGPVVSQAPVAGEESGQGKAVAPAENGSLTWENHRTEVRRLDRGLSEDAAGTFQWPEGIFKHLPGPPSASGSIRKPHSRITKQAGDNLL